jgi:hypothetical protein
VPRRTRSRAPLRAQGSPSCAGAVGFSARRTAGRDVRPVRTGRGNLDISASGSQGGERGGGEAGAAGAGVGAGAAGARGGAEMGRRPPPSLLLPLPMSLLYTKGRRASSRSPPDTSANKELSAESFMPRKRSTCARTVGQALGGRVGGCVRGVCVDRMRFSLSLSPRRDAAGGAMGGVWRE